MTEIEMLKGIIGKKVNVWTINSMFSGIVAEVEGEWIKIVSDGKKKNEFILKTDMITSITVLG